MELSEWWSKHNGRPKLYMVFTDLMVLKTKKAFHDIWNKPFDGYTREGLKVVFDA
jgi:hypothetical protein